MRYEVMVSCVVTLSIDTVSEQSALRWARHYVKTLNPPSTRPVFEKVLAGATHDVAVRGYGITKLESQRKVKDRKP